MGRGKSTTLRRPLRPTGRVETHADRNERMGQALRETLNGAEGYEQDPARFESALNELVVSLGSIGANMYKEGASETLEPEPPSSDDYSRVRLGRSLLWNRPEGLPRALQGPLYPVILTETRWRKLPLKLRQAITYRCFKRTIINRPAQYAYEQLQESSLPKPELAMFEAAMLAYAHSRASVAGPAAVSSNLANSERASSGSQLASAS